MSIGVGRETEAEETTETATATTDMTNWEKVVALVQAAFR